MGHNHGFQKFGQVCQMVVYLSRNKKRGRDTMVNYFQYAFVLLTQFPNCTIKTSLRGPHS